MDDISIIPWNHKMLLESECLTEPVNSSGGIEISNGWNDSRIRVFFITRHNGTPDVSFQNNGRLAA
jgi:hypothetical protein